MLHFRSLILLSALTLLGTHLSAMDDEITDFPSSPSSSPIEEIEEYTPPPSPSVEDIDEYNEELIPTPSKRKRTLQRSGVKDSSRILRELSRSQRRPSRPSRQGHESSPEISVEGEKENVSPPLRNRVILPGISQPVKGEAKKRRIDN